MKIIVQKNFNFDHRPEASFCTFLRASSEPRTVKRNVGEAAIEAGCAIEYKEKKQVKSTGDTNGESNNAEVRPASDRG